MLLHVVSLRQYSLRQFPWVQSADYENKTKMEPTKHIREAYACKFQT